MSSVDDAGLSEKRHRCNICGRRFARSEHLERHIRTHTKEKPFTCFCGQRFTRNDLLKRHRRRVHSSAATTPPVAPREAVPEGEQELEQDEEQGQNPIAVTTPEAPTLQSHDTAFLPTIDNPPTLLHDDSNAPDSPLHGFAAFMESIGMVPDWTSMDFFDVEPFQHPTQLGLFQPEEAQRSPFALQNSVAAAPTRWPDLMPEQESAPGNQPGSAPTTAEVHAVADAAGSEQALTPIPWRLTQQQWQTLANTITVSMESLRQFVMPSRPAISRYLQSYIHHFHKDYPMIHLPTYSPSSSPVWLTLAIAAVGAQCRFESKNGRLLYEAARVATLEQRRLDSSGQFHQASDRHRTIMIQTLVLLMVYGAWDWEVKLLDAALDLQSILSSYIRANIRDHLPIDDGTSQWRSWIHLETHRRTILIAYAFLVIQSIAYDVPPVVLTSEIQHLQLPCGAGAWESQSEQEWRAALRRSVDRPAHIKDVLRHLLHDSTEGADSSYSFSVIGSFIVLQALIQRIYLARQLDFASGTALPKSELDALQRALIRWKTICQRTVNSTVDPRHIDSPVPYTSAAFLALAFSRLHIDLGPCRQLQTRDPKQIATALLSTPTPRCSPEAVPALLHAAHALSVPVLMGVDSVLGSDTLSWSCEHSLCGLESGIFLWRWLQSAGESLTWDGLNTNEKGVVSWVLFSISETLQSIDASDLGLSHDTVLSELSFPRLGVLVLRIWARIFSSNTSWAITNEIGASLRLLAEAAEVV